MRVALRGCPRWYFLAEHYIDLEPLLLEQRQLEDVLVGHQEFEVVLVLGVVPIIPRFRCPSFDVFGCWLLSGGARAGEGYGLVFIDLFDDISVGGPIEVLFFFGGDLRHDLLTIIQINFD